MKSLSSCLPAPARLTPVSPTRTRWSALLLALLVAASMLATTGRATAGPIVESADIGGLRTFTDTATGLVWADLNNFFGLTYNEMKAAVEAAGFAVAVRSEVDTLLLSLDLSATPVASWDSYAAIMGKAPNRELIWGAYVPEVDPAFVSWAFAFQGDTAWSFDASTGFGVDSVPNGGSDVADMNIWAFQVNPTGAVPAPAGVILAGVGGLCLSGFGLIRRRFAGVAV